MTADAQHPRAPHLPGWRLLMWGGAAALLSLPLIAMQFTDEVNWSPFDFLVFGAMLAVACGGGELAVRLSRGNRLYRVGAFAAIAGGFLLVWVNLAVGFIGSENNPANLMYAGVLGIGVLGACIGRFRPRGMARAMLATAAAQLAAGVIAQVNGMEHPWPATAVFTALWLGSAGMFARAARTAKHATP